MRRLDRVFTLKFEPGVASIGSLRVHQVRAGCAVSSQLYYWYQIPCMRFWREIEDLRENRAHYYMLLIKV